MKADHYYGQTAKDYEIAKYGEYVMLELSK
jgi:hypothetical protein